MLALSRLVELAQSVGFDSCGIARARRLDQDALVLSRWLEAEHHGSMQYMTRDFEKRVNPQALVPGCKTVMVCVLSYNKGRKQVEGAPFISQSGLSKCDYHLVMKSYLHELENRITREFGEEVFSSSHQHLFCDSAPILERRWAQLAGIGAIGRNRQLISPVLGSYIHIGILLMNEESDCYSLPFDEDICRDCSLCLHACPTGALRADPFDARKCISYLTIERKEDLPARYEKAVANVLYGCDRCAEVCPYNMLIEPTTHEELSADENVLNMTADDWENLSRRQKLKLLHRLAK
ncbi:MAG: tRNA epoxyqueuosine(34) reductase QueG [Paludibacteraceae bacterium]|nr:tRNA epoxyqueuosine(34) reductase QueG [Paludibacteraceae bacterium]